MTTEELRAAADRIRDYLHGRSPQAIYPDAGDAVDDKCLRDRDIATLASGYLADHPTDDHLEPTPDRLRAAGFTQSNASDALFLYGTGPARLQYVDQDGGKWDMFFKSGEYCFDFADLKTMAAVRAWMKAVDAANGGAT